MNELVLHHTYIDGSTFDVSGHSNHGLPVDVKPGLGRASGSYEFVEPSSGILVEASPTLTTLGAIRVRMKIRISDSDDRPDDHMGWRNLIEGHLSFALFLTRHGGLCGSMRVRQGGGAEGELQGEWFTVWGEPSTVKGQWHEVEMAIDGVSRMVLKVDGTVVAEGGSMKYAVHSVGPLGITVGRWPRDLWLGPYYEEPHGDELDHTYLGEIGELQLWRYSPVRSITGLLDRCCERDDDALQTFLGDLRDAGLGWKELRAVAREVEEVVFGIIRAGLHDGADVPSIERLALACRLAVLDQVPDEVSRLRMRVQTWLDVNVEEQDQADAFQRIGEFAARLGLDRSRAAGLLQDLCLGSLSEADPGVKRDDSPPIRSGPWDALLPPAPPVPTRPRKTESFKDDRSVDTGEVPGQEPGTVNPNGEVGK